jgi:hypothetical protein
MKLLLRFSILVLLLVSACSTVPTSTPRPTKVPSTKTPVPRSTPTQSLISLRACVTDSTIRIRKGPGTEYEAIAGMVSGTCMSILGRNEDSNWVYMVSQDNKRGWVAAWLLTIEGDLSRVSVKSDSEALSLVPTVKTVPTVTRRPIVVSTPTHQSLLSRFAPVPLCSESADKLGESVSCIIQRADCVYRPDVNGSPTFCNDRPYPNQEFQLVIFGEDWSDYDGSCIVVYGYLETYRGVLQIQAFDRSQISYCQ